MLKYCFLSKPFDNVNSEVQQLFAIFTAVSHRSGSLEAQLNGVKRSSLCTMIGGFRSTLTTWFHF